MTVLIILIVLIIVGVYMAQTGDCDNREIIGIMMSVVFSILFIIHCIAYFKVSYSYGAFVEERNAFESTLNELRQNGSEYETAAIVKDVAEWNQKLAKLKYDNKTLFFDQYIDDRVDNLEPIK